MEEWYNSNPCKKIYWKQKASVLEDDKIIIQRGVRQGCEYQLCLMRTPE